MFDYEALRIIWWLLLGVLLTGFAIMDGFDLGAMMLLPFIGKNDQQRRLMINTVGPVWEGNQVWFILGGGAIFAAWPTLYAVAFSGFYLAMFLVLTAFIARPVAFKFRSKMPGATWRSIWDWVLAFSGFVPALICGVALGNVLQGVPFVFDPEMRMTYQGSFFGLLNPFAIVCGLVSVLMMMQQGALYLAIKTEDHIQSSAIKWSRMAGLLLIILFAVAGFWISQDFVGYKITSTINPNGPSNPLSKTVITQAGAWLQNYADYPWMISAPILGFTGTLIAILFASRGQSRVAFIGSSISIIGIISTAGLSMFPFLLPSSSNPNMSLTVWDASSSQFTLGLMLFATAVFMPIVLTYTSWVYYVMRGKLTAHFFNEHQQQMY